MSISLKELDTKMNNIKSIIKIKSNITILNTLWVDNTMISGFYVYDIIDADITATTMVDINIKLSDLEKASNIKSANESFDGYVRLYADAIPTTDILCDLKITGQVI